MKCTCGNEGHGYISSLGKPRAYATQKILLRGLPNLDFTTRPSVRKLCDPQLKAQCLNVEPTVRRDSKYVEGFDAPKASQVAS
jgi:hypothetical protein